MSHKSCNSRITAIFSLVSSLILLFSGCSEAGLSNVEKVLQEGRKGQGKCIFVFPSYAADQNTDPKDLIPNARVAYKRFQWADLEPSEGVYNFSPILRWASSYAARGYKVGIGVMSTSVGHQASPLWLYNNGVRGTWHMDGLQQDPVYWDNLYLTKVEQFTRALGQTLNTVPNLEFVDIRPIGVYGEMHFGTFLPGMWTKSELELHGLTKTAFVSSYIRVIKAYQSSFPSTKLFLNIAPSMNQIRTFFPLYNNYIPDGIEEVVEYAINHGINLRNDGLSISTPVSTKIISSIFIEAKILNPSILTLWEFAEKESDPDVLKKLFNLAKTSEVDYLHLNFVPDLKLVSQTIVDMLYLY